MKRLVQWLALAAGALAILALVMPPALMGQSTPWTIFDNGSAARPSRAYLSDWQLGSYRIQASNEGFASDGQLRWQWSGTAFHIATALAVQVGGTLSVGGNATLPDATLGTIRPSVTDIALASGALLGSATSDLGASGTRWRALYVGTSGVDATGPLVTTNSATLQNRVHVTGVLHAETSLALGAHVVTVGDNGQGSVANGETLAGTRSLYFVDCLDGDGCPLRLSETNIAPGSLVTVISLGLASHAVSFATVTGTQHVASSFTMNPAASISFVYIRNRGGDAFWVETGRSAN